MRQSGSAAALIFQSLQGLWTAHIVSAIAKLGIPDLLAHGSTSTEELAQKSGTDAGCLYRLLRAASALGVLAEDGPGHFRQTPLSDLLRSDSTAGMRGIAAFFSDEWHTRAWEHLLQTVQTGRPAIDLVYGVSFFEYLASHPEHAYTFFLGMTNLSSWEGPAIAETYDFTSFRKICDVGGGLGLQLALILERNPLIAGVLFDQPHIVEDARSQPFFRGLNHRVQFAAGDMFQAVPPEMDMYLLKRIIHDWPDADCIKLLRHCRSGVNPGGKALIVEQVILPHDESAGARLMDIEMMLLLGGKEREEADFRRILTDSGWKLTRIISTPSPMFVIEAEPA